MKKSTLLTAGFLAAGTLTFGAVSPAHAAPCGSGTFTIAQLEALGSTGCTIGDKQYYDFSFTGLSTGNFGFTVSGSDHTFSGQGLNFSGASFSYTYKVALFNAPAGQEFLSYNTSASGAATTSALAYTKFLETTTPVTAGVTQSIANPAPLAVAFPAGQITPVTFASVLTRTGGRIDIISDVLSQKLGEPEAVPGPLPILGAGAAFGFSRRLRSRIKRVAA